MQGIDANSSTESSWQAGVAERPRPGAAGTARARAEAGGWGGGWRGCYDGVSGEQTVDKDATMEWRNSSSCSTCPLKETPRGQSWDHELVVKESSTAREGALRNLLWGIQARVYKIWFYEDLETW